MGKRNSPSFNPTTSNYQTIDSVANIRQNRQDLFCVLSNLNKTVAGLGTKDNPKELNMLTQVRFCGSGVPLDKLAPLVGITDIK